MPISPRPGAGGSGGIKITTFEEFDRGKYLRPKEFGPATIVGKGHQRVERVEVALIGAKIGLQRPKRQQNPTRDTITRLDPIKDRIPFGRVLGAQGHAIVADHRVRELREWPGENALRAVRTEGPLVLGYALEEGVYDAAFVALLAASDFSPFTNCAKLPPQCRSCADSGAASVARTAKQAIRIWGSRE